MSGHVWCADCSSVDVDQSEVAWELSLELGDEAPLGELFRLWALDEEPSNLVASKLKPLHIVCEIEIQLVGLCVGLEQLTLGHELLLLSQVSIHLGTICISCEKAIFPGLG